MADPSGGQSVPECDVPTLVTQWLGPRRWYCSGTMPIGRRVAVVSSRLPRLLDPHGVWLQAMRSALHRLREPRVVALIGHATAAHEFVLRGAERQGAPRLVVWCQMPTMPLPSAGRVAADTPWLNRSDDLRADLWADSSDDSGSEMPAELSRTPQRDRATIAWADELIVLALRTRGNLHTLLRERLHRPGACVMLADLPGLQSRNARKDLMALGAEKWAAPAASPVRQVSEQRPSHKAEPGDPAGLSDQRFVPCPTAGGWEYLTHTTRACTGSWPGQSQVDYLDSLLDGRSDADHSPFRTLVRIVRQRRLIASSRAIRGGFGVVSFTAVPLAELPGLHVFRPHRARWDFEPYGICISRNWLRQYGVRPVIYAEDAAWIRLSAGERPYFQHVRRPSPSLRPAAGLDWSVEQEWRHVGDLDLSALAPNDAILFVPTAGEARMLLEFSPWPVTVLGASSQ